MLLGDTGWLRSKARSTSDWESLIKGWGIRVLRKRKTLRKSLGNGFLLLGAVNRRRNHPRHQEQISLQLALHPLSILCPCDSSHGQLGIWVCAASLVPGESPREGRFQFSAPPAHQSCRCLFYLAAAECVCRSIGCEGQKGLLDHGKLMQRFGMMHFIGSFRWRHGKQPS